MASDDLVYVSEPNATYEPLQHTGAQANSPRPARKMPAWLEVAPDTTISAHAPPAPQAHPAGGRRGDS